MGNAMISRRGGGGATIKFDCYSGLPQKISSINLSETKEEVAATSSNEYAVFAGGQAYSSGFIIKNSVDAYNASLIKSTPSVLSMARHGIAATAVAEYTIFAGGSSSSYSSDTQAVVDAYNGNLTRSTPTELSQNRDQFPATTVGNYALFAGGFRYAPSATETAIVDAYNGSLTKSTINNLSQARNRHAATSVGKYALFGGGSPAMSNNAYSTVDAYTDQLTKVEVSALSQARSYLAATTVGKYALFAGGVCYFDGNTGDTYFATVDVYDENLTKSTPINLSAAREKISATSVGNYGLFAGGDSRDQSSFMDKSYNTVDVIDKNLVRKTTAVLGQANSALSSTKIGPYALFGGGSFNDSDVIDVYSIAEETLSITAYKGSKYKFQNMAEEETVTADMETISIPTPATGYIKFKNTTIS